MNLLLVDPRPTRATGAVPDALREAGFALVALSDLGDAASALRHGTFDIAVLLFPSAVPALPDPVGIVRGIRAAGIVTPLIAAAVAAPAEGWRTRLDPVALLGVGADDVLAPGSTPAELAARCAALLRRCHGFAAPALTVGALTLDPAARSATLAGRALRLTAREFDVLRLLVLRHGQVVRKDAFLDRLYAQDADEPDGKIIDVFICKLRRKLAEAGGANLIATIWGVGYRLETREARASMPAALAGVA